MNLPNRNRIALPLTAIFVVTLPLIAAPPSAAARRRGPLAPARSWNRDRAAHLLRRAGFGGTPEEIDRLTRLGCDAAVNQLVDYYITPQLHSDFNAIESPDVEMMRERMSELDKQQRRAAFQRIERLRRLQIHDFRAWWLERMIKTNRPFEEKMTLFWHGLFTTGAREVRTSTWLIRQNAFLRAQALGRYRDLLIGISQDPAMLVYLDNASNRKDHPNENYARELLELFTLGEGNYTEHDITEAARALTGWTIDTNGFRVRRAWHDDGVKTIFGKSGNFDGEALIDLIVQRPEASQHLARKLLVFFLTQDPDRKLVNALAAELRRTDYDLRTTMKTLFKSEAFYAEKYRFEQIKSPVELVVGTARLLENSVTDFDKALRDLREMGQELYQPPNVKGWDGGRKWINTATLFARYNFASALVRGGSKRTGNRIEAGRMRREAIVLDVVANIEMYPGLSIPDRAIDPENQEPFDPLPLLEQHELSTADQVVDHLIARLLQRPIDDERRASLLELLGGPDRDFKPKRDRKRVIAVVNVILNMPEYQLN